MYKIDTEDLYNGLDDDKKKIIRARGMFKVDAGPGSGKTKTLVTRYLSLLNEVDSPQDIVMVTFTRGGAKEMRDRIVAEFKKRGIEYSPNEIRVSTFDSICNSIVKESTKTISDFFGTTDMLSRNPRFVDDSSGDIGYLEDIIKEKGAEDCGLDKWMLSLASKNSDDFASMIIKLIAYGVIPMESGWFEYNGVEGDTDSADKFLNKRMDLVKNSFEKIFDEDKDFTHPGDGITGGILTAELIRQALCEDRTKLFNLVHSIYLEYIRRSIRDDRLTFSLNAMFAFIVLYQNDVIREKYRCRYLMIDEFQDTDSNQFLIALMLLKEPELCVVGDFRQSIFGFRNTSYKNIDRFIPTANEMKKFLGERIPYDIPYDSETENVNSFRIGTNYRSSQEIIDLSYASLSAKAADKESELNFTMERIGKPLSASKSGIETRIESVKLKNEEEEYREIVARILHYVGNPDYPVYDSDCKKNDPKYGDISVLCRKRAVAKKIYGRLRSAGIPVYLHGDVEIMDTKEGKLLLAWGRYTSDPKSSRGLSAILAYEGYRADKIGAYIRDPPSEISAFKDELSFIKSAPIFMKTVFSRYPEFDEDMEAAISKAVMERMGDGFSIPSMTGFIASCIDNGRTFSLETSLDKEAVLIQTIHKSKGLEYPIVIVPHMDVKSFPLTDRSDSSVFTYSEMTGVRCSNTVVHGDYGAEIRSTWQSTIVSQCRESNNDEERRLMFVAVSRAKQYILFTATERASQFYKEIAEAYETEKLITNDKEEDPRPNDITDVADNIAEKPAMLSGGLNYLSVHAVIDNDQVITGEKSKKKSMGPEYGNMVHRSAELLAALDNPVLPNIEKDDLDIIKGIISELKKDNAEICTEVECSLPFEKYGVILNGKIDMIAFRKNGTIEIHDWKTDVNRFREKGYRQQISIYYHAIKKAFHDRRILCYLDFIRCNYSDNPIDEKNILTMEEIESLVKGYHERNCVD